MVSLPNSRCSIAVLDTRRRSEADIIDEVEESNETGSRASPSGAEEAGDTVSTSPISNCQC